MKAFSSLLLGALVLLAPSFSSPAHAQDVKVEYGIQEEDLEGSEEDEDEEEKNMTPQQRQCRKQCETRSIKCINSCGLSESCLTRCTDEGDACATRCDPKSAQE